MEFRFGIEHEVAFLNSHGRFADWTNTSYDDFAQIIAELPEHQADREVLHIGDAGIRHKRWYAEGLERLDAAGHLLTMLPKGIEIRTPPQPTIKGAVAELDASFALLRVAAASHGYTPVLTSFNPYQSAFRYDPPLNHYEQQLMAEEPELRTDQLAMLTYGPDLNLSVAGWAASRSLDAARKLIAFSPFIVAWTLSAPFANGKAWGGLSQRLLLRSGTRPTARVWLDAAQPLPPTALARSARLPAEAGRIEFKACDSCDDFAFYGALLALLKGLLLDTTLHARADTPDVALHQRAAGHGFADLAIAAGAASVLAAATAALGDDPDAALLAPLREALQHRDTPAKRLLQRYHEHGSLLQALRTTYA